MLRHTYAYELHYYTPPHTTTWLNRVNDQLRAKTIREINDVNMRFRTESPSTHAGVLKLDALIFDSQMLVWKESPIQFEHISQLQSMQWTLWLPESIIYII